MKPLRPWFPIALIGVSLLAIPSIAWAASGTTEGAIDAVFPWAGSGGFSANWLEGLGFVALGLVGAMITVYLFLDEGLPSMGGKAEYEELKVEIDVFARRRDKQMELCEQFARNEVELTPAQLATAQQLTQDFSNAIAQKEAARKTRRNSLLIIGLPIYIVLGGAFAVLFASNVLQAVLLGFGWTSFADRLGINRELTERSKSRQPEVDQLKEDASAGVQAKSELTVAKAQIKQLTDLTAALAQSTAPE